MSKEIVTYTANNVSPRFLTDKGYWRRKAREYGVKPDAICPRCHDTGMVPVLSIHGDDIEYDTCTRCMNTWAEPRTPHDDIPF